MTKTQRTNIGEQIKAARLARGWTQQHLGEKAGGIPGGQVGQVERGKNVTLETCRRLAHALDIELTIFGQPIRKGTPI